MQQPGAPQSSWRSRIAAFFATREPRAPQKSEKAMKERDVWEKGTGVTHFEKGVRYDTVESGSPKAVHEIVAPFYVQGKGPPSYESHSSFEKLER